MTNVSLTPVDIAQVVALLRVHAEMQDNRANNALETLGRLTKDNDGSEEMSDMIIDLQHGVKFLEDDCDNLRRIANLYDPQGA